MTTTTMPSISSRLGAALLLTLAAAAATAQQPRAAPQAPPAAPSAAPQATVSAQYRLSQGDIVRITVFQNADLSLETRINESGAISYPLLGNVTLSGLTITEAEQRIARGLRDGNFVRQPQVTINIAQVRGNQVSVLGHVGRPGRYPLETGEVRLTDLLATAGGVTPTGSEIVVVTGTRKGQPFRTEVELPTVFAPNRRGADLLLENGDVVYVERAPTIYMYGEVQRPGALRLERGMTVMQALAAAGGLNQRGTLRGMRVSRKDEAGRLREFELKLTDTLRPDDVVTVRESVF
jgi:polysaccharide biosynthesis/export protein